MATCNINTLLSDGKAFQYLDPRAQQIVIAQLLCDISASAGGATAFTDLTDVPASYTGQAGKVVAVNATETGLEFIAASGAGVPTGVIVMWSGTIATIPAGWSLCDGTGGTPDLTDKFIVGAKQDDAGVAKTNLTGVLTQTGGSITHDHSITDPQHNHTYNFDAGAQSGSDFSAVDAGASTVTFDAATGISVNTQDAPQPYYALAYIIKT